jgi:transposase
MAQSQNGNVATMMRSGQIAPERAAANKVLISLRIVAWLFPCRKKLSSNWLRFSILGQHGARICSVPSFRYLPGQREQYNPPACLNQESVGMKHDADDAGRAPSRPAWGSLNDYLDRWNNDGTLEKIHHALYVKCREQLGREASPTACVMDSQSVKSAEKGGPRSIRMGMMRARRSRARNGVCHERTKRKGGVVLYER